MFWAPLAVGAGLGLLKNVEGNRAASNQRKAQGEIQRWSPWTGLQGHAVQDPSLMGDLATGAAIGAMGSKMLPTEGAGEFLSSEMSNPQMGADPTFGFGEKQNSWLSLMNPQKKQPYSLTGIGQN